MKLVVETAAEDHPMAMANEDFVGRLQLQIARVADELSRSTEQHSSATDRELWRRAEEPYLDVLDSLR